MIYILVGPGASGKDFLRKRLENKGLRYGISYTTRPPREGEVDGRDYFFVSREFFEQKIKENEWVEYDVFGNNYYGTLKSQFDTDDIFIMTSSGLNQLSKEDRAKCLIIYLHVDDEIRKERFLKRGDSLEKIEKRIEEDKKIFYNFSNYDIKITNPDF